MSTLTPSRFGDLPDSDTFHLPVPGLFADLDAGSGSVALIDEFLNAPADIRMRVIQQWVRELNAQKEAALVQMFHDFVRPLQGFSSIVEQIDQFKRHCRRTGVSFPEDFAVTLQRY